MKVIASCGHDVEISVPPVILEILESHIQKFVNRPCLTCRQARDPLPVIVVGSCGHEFAWQIPPSRLEKANFLVERRSRKPCPACQKEIEQEKVIQGRAATSHKKKVGAKYLPFGTLIAMKRNDDGTWSGSLDANNRSAVARELSVKRLVKALMVQALEWDKADLPVGPVAIVHPDPLPRKSSRSIIDVRSRRKNLSAQATRRLLDVVDHRKTVEG